MYIYLYILHIDYMCVCVCHGNIQLLIAHNSISPSSVWGWQGLSRESTKQKPFLFSTILQCQLSRQLLAACTWFVGHGHTALSARYYQLQLPSGQLDDRPPGELHVVNVGPVMEVWWVEWDRDHPCCISFMRQCGGKSTCNSRSELAFLSCLNDMIWMIIMFSEAKFLFHA